MQEYASLAVRSREGTGWPSASVSAAERCPRTDRLLARSAPTAAYLAASCPKRRRQPVRILAAMVPIDGLDESPSVAEPDSGIDGADPRYDQFRSPVERLERALHG